MRPVTLALFFGNRGFFPESLIAGATRYGASFASLKTQDGAWPTIWVQVPSRSDRWPCRYAKR